MACCLAAESMPVATAGTSLSHCHRAPKRISCAGLGRKSAACVLLLALAKRDFPVDVNVGRICARLGWIPLDSEEALEARPLPAADAAVDPSASSLFVFRLLLHAGLL